MWLFTDPGRLPDSLAAAARLPRGAGVVHRHFGEPGAIAQAAPLAQLARARGLTLLIAADVDLARRVGAAGVHIPQRFLGDRRLRRRWRRDWIRTAAAHDARAIRRAAAAGMDAAFVSPVFPSRSPSAGRALGVLRLAGLAQNAALPVMALGGVTPVTAARVLNVGVVGVAAVDALAARPHAPAAQIWRP